jgi:hypothetical protein
MVVSFRRRPVILWRYAGEESHRLAGGLGVLHFSPRRFPDVPAHVQYKNLVSQVDLTQMQFVEPRFYGGELISWNVPAETFVVVVRATGSPDAQHDLSGQRLAKRSLLKRPPEASRPAQTNNPWVLSH